MHSKTQQFFNLIEIFIYNFLIKKSIVKYTKTMNAFESNNHLLNYYMFNCQRSW
jgi:hypothetical protein